MNQSDTPVQDSLAVLAGGVIKRAESTGDVFRHALDVMERQLGHTVRLVDELLYVSRITRNRLEIHNARVELAPVIYQALGACQPLNLRRFLFAASILALLTAVGGCSSSQKELQASLDSWFAQNRTASNPSVGDRRLLKPKAVFAFYDARKTQPAWELPTDGEAIRQAIAGLEQDGLTPSDYHLAAINTLLDERRKNRSAKSDAGLEILLSDAIAAMVDHVRYGRVHPVSLNPHWNINPRQEAPPLHEVLARIEAATSVTEGIEKEKIDHFIYQGLKKALARLVAIEAAGGWPTVPGGKAIKAGATDQRIPAIRKRLAVTGEIAEGAPLESAVYDPQLQAAVELFQARHRLATGTIDQDTFEAMNVSATARADQVRVNLERARWVLSGLQEDFLLVNLPAFKAYLIRDGKNIWEARTQIGREARRTPAFRAQMKHFILNPNWTVPETILEEDVLGGMKRGEDVITKKQLLILDRAGNQVDPSAIDWANATPAAFPYTLRQEPGPNNALGRVKFIFPNPHDIFLHDTPSRDLFQAEKRTFSSGCIRIENPLELATALVSGTGDWDGAKIQRLVESGESRQVDLPKPLPVLIVYWTVSVGASGELRFAPDVYGLDPPVLRALPSPLPLGPSASDR